ncbi:hypothetical protein ACHAXN_000160 [Cyclotella atomus]
MNRLPDMQPALQTRVGIAPHPSVGMGIRYSQDTRDFAMHIRQFNQLNSAPIQLARTLRYVNLLNQFGHCRLCRRTGNKRAEILQDHNFVFLVLFRIAFPKSSAAQINAFSYRVNYGNVNFRFYLGSQSQLQRNELASQGSVAAQLHFNHICQSTCGRDIRVEDLVDLDECRLFVKTAEKKIGKAFVGRRVRQEGNPKV